MLYKLAGNKNLELSVLIVDSQRMIDLNRTFLGKNEPTDVLAFPMMEKAEIESLRANDHVHCEPLGDIVICLPVAREQARERHSSEMEEMELLAAHGLLHLFGYEDETEEGQRQMKQMEAFLLGHKPGQNNEGD